MDCDKNSESLDWQQEDFQGQIFERYNFCWGTRISKVLGINFSTDMLQISALNFDKKLKEIKNILKV